MDEGIKNSCVHEQFEAVNKVARLTEGEGGPVIAYQVDCSIKCVQCGMRFEFVGVPAGVSPNHPMCSADFLEMRIPIRPATGRGPRVIEYDFKKDKSKIIN